MRTMTEAAARAACDRLIQPYITRESYVHAEDLIPLLRSVIAQALQSLNRDGFLHDFDPRNVRVFVDVSDNAIYYYLPPEAFDRPAPAPPTPRIGA